MPQHLNIINSATYRVSIKFIHEIDSEEKLYYIMVPPNITLENIKDTIRQSHEELTKGFEDDSYPNYYANEGENADTLLWYINKKYGWEYREVEPDFEIVLQ